MRIEVESYGRWVGIDDWNNGPYQNGIATHNMTWRLVFIPSGVKLSSGLLFRIPHSVWSKTVHRMEDHDLMQTFHGYKQYINLHCGDFPASHVWLPCSGDMFDGCWGSKQWLSGTTMYDRLIEKVLPCSKSVIPKRINQHPKFEVMIVSSCS